MILYYNIKIEGYCDGYQEYEIDDDQFMEAEKYMKEQYAIDTVEQMPELKGRKIEITPLYNEHEGLNGKSLKVRNWFEQK
jgi:hypothetical protein